MHDAGGARRGPRAGTPLVVDIVDPQPVSRVGLAVALTHVPEFQAGEIKSRPAELSGGTAPVVVGLSAGGTDEIEAVRRLAERGRRVLVLLPEESWQAWAALRQHVAGGLSRHAAVARVMTALRAVAAGQSYWWLDPARPGEERPTIAGRLSARERELLGLLAVGCSDREIADQLVISVRTVWSHLERIRAKTGVRGRVELAMLAWHVDTGTLPEPALGDGGVVRPRRPLGDEPDRPGGGRDLEGGRSRDGSRGPGGGHGLEARLTAGRAASGGRCGSAA